MGEGNGNWKVPVIGLWNEAFQKNYSWRSSQFIFNILDPVVFPGSAFFSESSGKFCRIEVQHV